MNINVSKRREHNTGKKLKTTCSSFIKLAFIEKMLQLLKKTALYNNIVFVYLLLLILKLTISHTPWIIVGIINAINKTINANNLSSGVWVTPAPSTSLNQIIANPITKMIIQNMLPIHQKYHRFFTLFLSPFSNRNKFHLTILPITKKSSPLFWNNVPGNRTKTASFEKV